MSEQRRFGTAINCIDGRVQQPVADWVKSNFRVEYVDMVTEPGPDKALSAVEASPVNLLRDKVSISVKAHGSRVVAIAGHHECAANPGSREEHVAQLRKAAKVIASWRLPVTVALLWVGADWKVEFLGTAPGV